MSAQETDAALSAQQSYLLDQEASALASDILPIFTSKASTESIWSAERIAFINERRSIVHGQKLFFDELLCFASVDTSIYPPRSAEQLSSLLEAIFAATTLDYLKQLSLVYYLLLDLDACVQRLANDQGDASADAGSSATEQFADTYVVLPQFTDAMQGYWLLDNDQYEQAVPLLAVADFIPKIVRTLYLPAPNEKRSDVSRAKLLLRFLRTSNQATSSPPGSEPFLQEVEIQIQALCFLSGPARAFAEIRALTFTIQDDEQQRVSVRARLIFKVLEHCFAPPRSAAIQNLLACSLDPEEEVTLESFVLSPPAAMTATWSYVAADVLIIRYISQGRYMDAVGLDRRLGPDVSQGHSTARDAQQRSKMMEQRKRMIAGAREILPEVQKELLRIEESADISGGVVADSNSGKDEGVNGVHANGKSAVNDFADRSGVVHTPLSASPVARRINNQTPTTQAAILSAVVRASASPSAPSTPSKVAALGAASPASIRSGSGTPGRAGLTPQHNPAAMIGFLAKNALSGKRSISDGDAESDSAKAAEQDESMQDELEEIDGSAVLVPKPTEAAKPAAPASPWRNQPSLTSSSPFSGLPKLTRPAFPGPAASGGAGSVASGSRSPYASTPLGGFQPATNSPFASSSMRSSPSLSSSTSVRGGKLSGAIGLVSQHGKKSRLGREEHSFDAMQDSDDDVEQQTQDDAEDFGDDTFVQTHQSKAKNGDVSIGRLVPGRRGWKETQEPEAEEMQQVIDEPPSKRRTRKAASPVKKMTRSRTGVNLASSAEEPSGGLSKSRSEVSLAGKRTTRSASAANRKPLTLSNLAQHSQEDAGMDTAPIARRTRAATAEQESVAGSQAQGGAASTIYTISEVGGDDDLPTKSPVKRGGRRTAAATGGGKASVRRSSRLGSVEPEAPEMTEINSPAKRRGGGRKSRMPGGLE